MTDLERAVAFVEAAADDLQGQGIMDHYDREVLLRVAREMRAAFGLAGECHECGHKHLDRTGQLGCWACGCGHPAGCHCGGCLAKEARHGL